MPQGALAMGSLALVQQNESFGQKMCQGVERLCPPFSWDTFLPWRITSPMIDPESFPRPPPPVLDKFMIDPGNRGIGASYFVILPKSLRSWFKL